MATGTKAHMEAVLRQFVRYCNQWQRANGPFHGGDGRILILKNSKKVLGIKD